MRNPDWARDELILALELYFRAGRNVLDATHKDVIELSSVLNNFGVHDGQARGEAFRNPNGVGMKLANFSSIDPDKPGTGLTRGNKLEQVIWDEFAGDTDRLYAVAASIRKLGTAPAVSEPIRGWDPEGEEEEFPEGKLLTRLHIARERNPSAVRKKKQAVLKATGKLSCECCGFDFEATYGRLGSEYAECHHRVPLADLEEGAKTKLADLAIVCANCHRMLHRSGNTITVEELREILTSRASHGTA